MASKARPFQRTTWPPAPSGSQYRSIQGISSSVEGGMGRLIAVEPDRCCGELRLLAGLAVVDDGDRPTGDREPIVLEP
jgi:hypothetical protein